MNFERGMRIGPYEIVAPLGAGGMGEVYRARDTKLDRDVAIKFLPDLVAADPDPSAGSGSPRARSRDERLKRFDREAKTLASLNHPNIAQVHGVVELPTETGRDKVGLVMELVEGEDLAERLKRGAIPLDAAITIARQIAEALEAAHERGIIHRDLKPANLKVRDDGTVKVLDFGLAKAIEQPADADSSDVMNSPTITSPATMAGVILGTAAYMAPEQAKGRAVDKRADIWAFGCVLYEMITGHRPFAGSDVAETLALILTKEVDWRLLPGNTPPTVRQLLRRCLQKDPRERLRDIGDARLQLKEALSGPVDQTPAQPPMRWRVVSLVALAAALAVLAATFAWLAFGRERSTGPPAVVRFSIEPPLGTEFPVEYPNSIFSPDGSRLLFVLTRGEQRFLAIRSLDAPEPTKIAGTDDASRPFFSPDGRWVAFTQHRQLKRVPVEGGTPLVICPAEWGGGAWNIDDTIIFTPNYTSGLWRVAARGGTPSKLTDPDRGRGELAHFWPQFLPGGRHVIYTSFSTPVERSRISLYSLDTGQQRTLVEGGMHPWYAPTGHLLYAGRGSIVAVPFDLQQLSVIGTAVGVLDDVLSNSSNGLAQFGMSASGSIAYVRASSSRRAREILWADRNGGLRPAVPGARMYLEPQLSPDGQRLVLTIEEPKRDVWTYDFSRESLSKVTAGTASEFGAIWAPDSRHIVFVSERPVFHVYRKSITEADEEPLVTGRYDTSPSSFSPDGQRLVYTQADPQSQGDLWLLSVEGERTTRPLVATAADEDEGMISPDGHWIAYTSDASGRPEIYVQAFPEARDRWQVSNEGGQHPRWGRNGREIFYLAGGRVMAAPVEVSATRFSAGKAALVLEGNYIWFDVAPGGQRFIVLRRDPAAQPVQVQVVVNWFAELKKRMTGGER